MYEKVPAYVFTAYRSGDRASIPLAAIPDDSYELSIINSLLYPPLEVLIDKPGEVAE